MVGVIGAGSSDCPGQPAIHRGGRRTSLGDRPDDQALAAAHVAGDEDPVDVGGEVGVPGDVAAIGELDAEPVQQRRRARAR